MIAFSTKKAHPLANVLGLVDSEMPSFEDILSERYESRPEKLWQDLLSKNPKQRFNFFVDTEILNKTLLQYWKSIFVNHTADSLFQLYNFFILDNRLKSFLQKSGQIIPRQQFYNSINFMTRDEFNALYEQVQPVDVLRNADKRIFSFEYLMADYFFNPNSKYAGAFKTKMKNLAWRSWINDAEILKGEILNAFYDVRKLVPHIKIDFTSIPQVEHIILNEPMLRWILDDQFHEDNADYIRATYDKQIFLDLHRNMYSSWGGKSETFDALREGQTLADDQFMLTELVFEERYDEFLVKDIEKGFGSVFTNDHLRQKSNQLLPGFIYEKVRNNRTNELQPFELA